MVSVLCVGHSHACVSINLFSLKESPYDPSHEWFMVYMQNTASHTAIAGRVAVSKRNKVED